MTLRRRVLQVLSLVSFVGLIHGRHGVVVSALARGDSWAPVTGVHGDASRDASPYPSRDLSRGGSPDVGATHAVSSIPNAEVYALQKLFNSTNGLKWTNRSGWNGPPSSVCTSWFGIQCDAADVSSIVLNANNLDGQLPSSIGDFDELNHFSVGANRLSGQLPADLTSLWHLNFVNISRNGFVGSLPPTIGQLYQLATFDCSHNNFSGPLPSFSSNTRLVSLIIGHNPFGGQLPRTLGNLPDLQTLDMAHSQLGGSIPPGFGASLTSLEALDLSDNLLTGGLPYLRLDADLYLQGNNLTGQIALAPPSTFRRITINLSANYFSGPPDFSDAEADYVFLDLTFNCLTIEEHDIPQCVRSLSPWTCLVTPQRPAAECSGKLVPGRPTQVHASLSATSPDALFVSWESPVDSGGSAVQGYLIDTASGPSLPSPISVGSSARNCTVKGLVAGTDYSFAVIAVNMAGQGPPSLPSNNIAPITIPPASEIRALKALFGSTNGLLWKNSSGWASGSELAVCSWFGVSCSDGGAHVQQLALHANNLTGTLPSALGDLSSLNMLDLSGNSISGALPDLANLKSLGTVNVSSNLLSGSAISGLCGVGNSLSVVDATSNLLSGTLPSCLGALSGLVRLLLGHNGLTFPLPESFGALGSLIELDLSYNDFGGPLSTTIGELGKLQVFDASHNRISGSIPPWTLSHSVLRHVQLEHNQLTGPIPAVSLSMEKDLMDFSNNQLTGSIPSTIAGLQAVAFDVSGNRLNGTLPPSIGQHVQRLFLEDNYFSGPLPNNTGTELSVLNITLNCLNTSSPAPPACVASKGACTLLPQRTPEECGETPSATPPSPPRDVTALPRASSSLVRWSPPADSGGLPLLYYTVYAKNDSLGPALSAGLAVPGNTTSTVVTNLVPGVPVTFDVTATNAIGTSAASSPSLPVIPCRVVGPPSGPSSVSAVRGLRAVDVYWGSPTDDGCAAVSNCTVSCVSPSCTTLSSTFPPSSHSGAIGPLSTGVAVMLEVFCSNLHGPGPAVRLARPVAPFGVPGAPGTPFAVGGDRNATVSWTPPSMDGGAPVTHYTVKVLPSGTSLNTTSSHPPTLLVSPLDNGVEYSFVVFAWNVAGQGVASSVSNSVTPRARSIPPPHSPKHVRSAATPGSILVAWDQVEDNGGSPLRDYAVVARPGGAEFHTPNGSVTELRVSNGLLNGTRYSFVVSARNGVGVSPASFPSAPVLFSFEQQLPAAPGRVTALAGDQNVTVSWMKPFSDGGVSLSGFVVVASDGRRFVQPVDICSSWDQCTCVLDGFVHWAPVSFTVAAVSGVGTGDFSEPSGVVVPSPPITRSPGQPRNLLVSVLENSLRASWLPANDAASPPAERFILSFRLASNASASPIVIQTDEPYAGISLGDIIAGSSYVFSVAAVGTGGVGPASDPLTVTIPEFGTRSASDVSCASINTTTVSVWFDARTSGTSNTCKECCWLVFAVPNQFLGKYCHDPPLQVSGLQPFRSYSIWVSWSSSPDSELAPSEPTEFPCTPGATAPGPVSHVVVLPSTSALNVSWSPPAELGGAPVAFYNVTASLVPAGPFSSVRVPGAFSTTLLRNVTNGEVYSVSVTPYSSGGAGPVAVAPKAVSPVAQLPSSPLLPSATFNSSVGELTIQWSPSASASGLSVSSYSVFDTSHRLSATVGAGSGELSAVFRGIPPSNQSYDFRVIASSAAGNSSAAVVPRCVPNLRLPPPPSQVFALAIGAGVVNVTWTASPVSTAASSVIPTGVVSPNEASSAPTGAVVTIFTDQGFHSQQEFPIEPSFALPQLEDTLLGKEVEFCVAIRSCVGVGPASCAPYPVRPALSAPSAPLGLFCNSVCTTADGCVAELSWDPPALDGGEPGLSYAVFGNLSGVVSDAPMTLTGTYAKGATVGPLEAGKTYSFAVRALNKAGYVSSLSAFCQPVVPSLSPPTAPTISFVGPTWLDAGDVLVEWKEVTGMLAAGHPPIRMLAMGGDQATNIKVVAVPQASTEDSVTVVAPRDAGKAVVPLHVGVRYDLRLAAYDQLGTGAFSGSLLVVPPAVPPSPPRLLAVKSNDGSLEVHVGAPASSGGSPITSVIVRVFRSFGATAAMVRVFPAPDFTTQPLVVPFVGLENGLPYSVDVTATNIIGASAAAPSGPANPCGKPGAPTLVSASGSTDQASVYWLPPANSGCSFIASYRVLVRRVHPYRVVREVDTFGNATSVKVHGLRDGYRYNFGVVAINNAGYLSDVSPHSNSVLASDVEYIMSWLSFYILVGAASFLFLLCLCLQFCLVRADSVDDRDFLGPFKFLLAVCHGGADFLLVWHFSRDANMQDALYGLIAALGISVALNVTSLVLMFRPFMSREWLRSHKCWATPFVALACIELQGVDILSCELSVWWGLSLPLPYATRTTHFVLSLISSVFRDGATIGLVIFTTIHLHQSWRQAAVCLPLLVSGFTLAAALVGVLRQAFGSTYDPYLAVKHSARIKGEASYSRQLIYGNRQGLYADDIDTLAAARRESSCCCCFSRTKRRRSAGESSRLTEIVLPTYS